MQGDAATHRRITLQCLSVGLRGRPGGASFVVVDAVQLTLLLGLLHRILERSYTAQYHACQLRKHDCTPL